MTKKCENKNLNLFSLFVRGLNGKGYNFVISFKEVLIGEMWCNEVEINLLIFVYNSNICLEIYWTNLGYFCLIFIIWICQSFQNNCLEAVVWRCSKKCVLRKNSAKPKKPHQF